MAVVEPRACLVVLAVMGIVACSTPSGTPAEPASAQPPAAAATTAAPFGKLGDTPVQVYTLTNKNGLVAKITNYGAIVTELHVPDRTGRLADVVSGFDTLDGYLTNASYFGAIVGRVANRIGNAAFALDGTRYTLAANDKPGCPVFRDSDSGYCRITIKNMSNAEVAATVRGSMFARKTSSPFTIGPVVQAQ